MSASRFNYRTLKGCGLQMDTTMDFATVNYLRVWVIEKHPCKQLQAFQPDVARTVRIRIGRVATLLADKLGLRFPVCLFGVSTLAASAGSISRVNLDQRNTGSFGLVGQKASKLRESPAMQSCPFSSSGPDPRSNASQFLDGNSTIRAFGGLDYAFGNCVINVASKVCLALAAFLQETFGGLCSFALQLSAKGAVAIANLIQMGARIVRSIGVVGNLYNSHIHTETVHRLNLLVFRDIDSDVKEPLSVAENQVGLAARVCEQSALLLAAYKRHLGSPVERPDAHGGRNQIQGKYAGVVSNTAVFAKHALNLFIQLVGVNDLGVEEADDLSGQRELVTNLAVVGFVERESVKLLRVPSQLRKAIGGAVHCFQRGTQGIRLNWRWQQFNLDSQFHFNQCISKP